MLPTVVFTRVIYVWRIHICIQCLERVRKHHTNTTVRNQQRIKLNYARNQLVFGEVHFPRWYKSVRWAGKQFRSVCVPEPRICDWANSCERGAVQSPGVYVGILLTKTKASAVASDLCVLWAQRRPNSLPKCYIVAGTCSRVVVCVWVRSSQYCPCP